jgi:hypothetical protein
MFSSIPLSKHLNPFGDHQRFNRLAYKKLRRALPDDFFPNLKDILKFEGKHGPDGQKFQDAVCEEQHFLDPSDPLSSPMMEHVWDHYENLIVSLRSHDIKQSAYHAAWLAHGLVDGLTPAHHIPYPEIVESLTTHHENRNTYLSRLFVKGSGIRDTIKKTNKLMGPKGLLLKHTQFECAAALSMQFFQAKNTHIMRSAGSHVSLPSYYAKAVSRVAKLNMYSRFEKSGYNVPLIMDSRRTLGPTMVEVVSTFWYHAAQEALK